MPSGFYLHISESILPQSVDGETCVPSEKNNRPTFSLRVSLLGISALTALSVHAATGIAPAQISTPVLSVVSGSEFDRDNVFSINVSNFPAINSQIAVMNDIIMGYNDSERGVAEMNAQEWDQMKRLVDDSANRLETKLDASIGELKSEIRQVVAGLDRVNTTLEEGKKNRGRFLSQLFIGIVIAAATAFFAHSLK